MKLIKFKASKNDEGRTLYKYLLKQLSNVPLSKIEKIFRLKDIRINGKKTNEKNYLIKFNDDIWVYGIENYQDQNNFIKTSINFEKVFEDDNILVINKPYGVSMHGFDDSLDNQVLTYLNFKKNDSFLPASIGRLDRSTSGLVIYAKNYQTVVQMNNKINHFEKFYLLKSDFEWSKKHVIFYARKNLKNYKMELFEEEKPNSIKMETIFFMDKNKKYAKLVTGKKHQIRLSLEKLGFPIYGDKKYGGKFDKRVFLHSHKIVLHNLENELDYLNGISFVSNIKW